jgi:hypothetical protein
MIWFHVSELAIDQLLAGELHRADEAAIRDHAESCARCGALLADALSVQRAFAAEQPRLRLPRRSLVPMAAAFALAAGVALVVTRPHDAVRTKGTAILGGFIAHGDQVRRAGAHESIAVGDRVELATTTSEPVWFAAVGADGTLYIAPTRVPAAREHVLPVSVVLDGSDTITGIFCAEAFDPKAPPPDCTVDHLTLEAP